MMYCVDASVIVSAALGSEHHSERSRMFFTQALEANAKFLVPEFTVPEIASATLRATQKKLAVYHFIKFFRNLDQFLFVSVERLLSDRATGIVLETGLRPGDALYVALAASYGIPLVTLDKEQLEKGRRVAEVREP